MHQGQRGPAVARPQYADLPRPGGLWLAYCRELCGFTHPLLLEVEGKAGKFSTFQALRKHIEASHQQFFCDVCLKGRKVRAGGMRRAGGGRS